MQEFSPVVCKKIKYLDHPVNKIQYTAEVLIKYGDEVRKTILMSIDHKFNDSLRNSKIMRYCASKQGDPSP
jgi:hypothetical protein